MAEIRPFRAIRPREGYEDKIAALPYDVVSLAEAGRIVGKEPLSFLAVDLPETVAKEGENIYEKAGRLLRDRIAQGYFVQDELPGFYVYELSSDQRSQTGIGALTCVDDYLQGTICRHENTRADKEADRVCHVQACGAQTGPIFLAYRAREEISQIVAQIRESQPPIYDFVREDQVRHRLWVVQDVEDIEAVFEAFSSVSRFYIADGHHRCSAAVTCALNKRRENPDYTGEEPWNFILSVLFPDEELKILDYNRVVRDKNGLTTKQLLAQTSRHFTVEFSGREPIAPAQKGIFGMYVEGGWYRLYSRQEDQSQDPVEGLDVAFLQKYLLEPVLGIADPRMDKRIFFVGGNKGVKELEYLVQKEGGVAFSLCPTSLKELFAVADAGRLMPPKSTWFEPKLLSGLLIHGLEE